jgi:diguanylate cyclase (GGDEF)-like protein
MNQAAVANSTVRKAWNPLREEEVSTSDPPRVLVLEDERIVAADLQRMLQELGYDADAYAASGSKALALAQQRPPAVVLADIRIQGSMDGIDTAIQLHELYGCAVLFLTAHADDVTVTRARRAEPAGYLIKPTNALTIKAALELALDQRVREAAARARERALREKELDLIAALQHLPVAVQLEDAEGHLVHVNAAFCALFALAEDPTALRGADAAAFTDRVLGRRCQDPERFTLTTECLRRAGEATAGDVISLLDGRTLELGFAPIVRAGVRRGQLWTYRDISETERERQDLERTATRYHRETLVDPLTGLTSRRGFFDLAPTYLKYLRRGKDHERVLFFVDLDGLKTINDRHGHAAGDDAIRAAAQALRATFGVSDLLARVGGDEFVVLATIRAPQIEEAKARLTGWLEAFNRTVAPPYELAVSVGTTPCIAGESLDTLISRADAAMYREKGAKQTRESPRRS